MPQYHLAHLVAAFVDGVERGHRLLEDHGDAFAAHLGHPALVEVLDVGVANQHAVGADAADALVEQVHHGQRAYRLARA